MANLILPRHLPAPTAPVMVSAENAHEYHTPHPIHPTFKVLLRAIRQLNPELRKRQVYVDMSIPNFLPNGKENVEETRKDQGVFEAKFDHWTIVLNWTEEKRRNLPPDYFGIDFGNSSAGIIGPHANIRTCWKCGLTGFRDPGLQYPCVVPGQPCPNCKNRDWWGVMVSQNDLIKAAAAAIQDNMPEKKGLWEDWGGKDADLRSQGIAAGALPVN